MDDDTQAAPEATQPGATLNEQAWTKHEPPAIAPYREADGGAGIPDDARARVVLYPTRSWRTTVLCAAGIVAAGLTAAFAVGMHTPAHQSKPAHSPVPVTTSAPAPPARVDSVADINEAFQWPSGHDALTETDDGHLITEPQYLDVIRDQLAPLGITIDADAATGRIRVITAQTCQQRDALSIYLNKKFGPGGFARLGGNVRLPVLVPNFPGEYDACRPR
jgi:hypothetical protein